LTNDGSPGPHGKAALIRKIGPLLLTISSALLGIILFELFCWMFVPSIGANLPGRDRRVVFFDGRGAIFENHGDIFTYLPHNEIRNVTGFFSDDDFAVEYDYRYRTNESGLVQDTDIAPARDSLLLLGDSFTEGQGAEPWFPMVSPTIEKLGYQAINGGILGTGFQQWLKLDRYLVARNIQIRKLAVLFISDDYHRAVWNIPPPVFECLSAPRLCRVEDSYFYRLPPSDEMSSWIGRVRKARGPMRPRLKMNAAALLPATHSVYLFLKNLNVFARAERGSHAAIAELIRIYGPKNVAFIHLPQKDELDHGPNDLGLRARRAIDDAGGKLFDGFKLCQLTRADYYMNDEHPNKQGYTKIAACAAKVINEFVAEDQ
jgi:lysophospholipase L1-like esterase